MLWLFSTGGAFDAECHGFVGAGNHLKPRVTPSASLKYATWPVVNDITAHRPKDIAKNIKLVSIPVLYSFYSLIIPLYSVIQGGKDVKCIHVGEGFLVRVDQHKSLLL